MRVFPFMAVLGTLMRWRRGESLVLAALLLACLWMPAAAQGAALPPQQAQAVLLWLQAEMTPASVNRIERSEDFRALTNRDNSPIYSSAAPVIIPAPIFETRLATLQVENRLVTIFTLESHESAFLTGVRNNRRRH